MTVASTTARNEYTGNGSTDTYDYTFKIFNKNDLEVVTVTNATPPVESVLTVDTDYTVADVGESAGGSITLTAGNLTSGYKIIIRRKADLKQETSIRNQSKFYASVHEDEFDRRVMAQQQQQDELDRSVKLPPSVTSSDFDPTLPTGVSGAVSKAPITNADGDGFAAASDWPTASEIANAQTYATNAANSATAAASSATEAASSASAAATSVASVTESVGNISLSISAAVASSALTITAKGPDGNDAAADNPISAAIRDATLTNGEFTLETSSSNLSLVIPSGATFGQSNGEASEINLYLVNNDGTLLLAAAGEGFKAENGVVSTTAIGTGADSASVLYANSAVTDKAARWIGYLVNTQATAGTWDAAPASIHLYEVGGKQLSGAGVKDEDTLESNSDTHVPTQQSVKAYVDGRVNPSTRSKVWVEDGNGHGSTNNKIRRFSTTNFNTGSAITYADSATDGATFTINEDGIYSILMGDRYSTSFADFGISLNASGADLTTQIESLADTKRIAYNGNVPTACNTSVSWVGYLANGDVVRHHTDGNPNGSTHCYFKIEQVIKF